MRHLIVAAALAVACGTSGSTGAGSSDSPPADAGTASVPDAGAPAGSDAGTTPAADGGTAAGASDAGSGAADCDGLRFPAEPGPAPASHFIWFHDSSGEDGCLAAGTTGAGTLALEMRAHAATLDFVSPAGILLRTATTAISTSFFGEQATFFDDMQLSATNDLRIFDDDGAEQPQDRRDISLLAEDPTGGAVGRGSFACIVSLDASLATRWTAPCRSPATVALAVDRSGATLYVFDGSTAFGANSMGAMWVDAHGNAGQPFELSGPQAQSVFAHPVTLAQRVGSGFFVQNGPDWVGQIDAFSTTLSPPPAWLQIRPNTSLHMVHGGTGYAVLPAASATCAQGVEVISPTGASCGTTRFTAAGSGCTVQTAIVVGYDGTVIQRAPDPDPAHQEWFGPGTCYWHWWPAFFK
jgi:hypothetical protein